MQINNDYAQEADFSKFKTFQYKATEEATIADTDSLADQRIIAGVEREMKANGFTEASSNPDVYVPTFRGSEPLSNRDWGGLPLHENW